MEIHDTYVILELSSFRGISIGAVHYYGKLVGYVDGKYTIKELEYALNVEQAEKLSKADDWEWDAGTLVSRFDGKSDVRDLAISTYKNTFPNCKILCEGSFSSAEPQRCLYADDKWAFELLNVLYKENEELSRASVNYSKRDKLWHLFEITCFGVYGIVLEKN